MSPASHGSPLRIGPPRLWWFTTTGVVVRVLELGRHRPSGTESVRLITLSSVALMIKPRRVPKP